MDFLAVFVLTMIIGVILAIWKCIYSSNKVEEITEKIKNTPDFDADDSFVSSDDFTGVAVDRKRQEFLLVNAEKLRRFNVRSIVSCEVIEDGTQIAYANRGSQLAGMAIGGALLGGVGAVVGGLSGSQRNVNKVKRLVLRYTTDDFDNPVHDILVYQSPFSKGDSRDGFVYSAKLKDAERWHARTVAMMKAVDPSR